MPVRPIYSIIICLNFIIVRTAKYKQLNIN